MNREADLLYEDQASRDRMSRLSEASVYNNERPRRQRRPTKIHWQRAMSYQCSLWRHFVDGRVHPRRLEYPFGSKDARDHSDPSQISKIVPSTVLSDPPIRS